MSGKSMCFQWEYAGRFNWLLTLFKDMAFTFMSYAKNGYAGSMDWGGYFMAIHITVKPIK